MQREKKQALLYPEAIDKYFGGIKTMNAGKLSFKCICSEGVMSLPAAYSHIRDVHKERIVKKRKESKAALKSQPRTLNPNSALYRALHA